MDGCAFWVKAIVKAVPRSQWFFWSRQASETDKREVEKVAESQRNWLKRPLAKIAASLQCNTLADPVRNCAKIENWKINSCLEKWQVSK